MAVADSVEAMLSDRPYRPTRSLGDVVAEVTRCAGTHFDPVVSQVFLALAAERGTTLFKNSATRVDQLLQGQGGTNAMAELRYLKKSMVPSERPYFPSHSNGSE
jgi:HD-GYP domain-containing protein (c-di-GMP phosphodiesterase class II)